MQEYKDTTSLLPSFTELHSLVAKYLTQGSDVQGWRLDATGKSPGSFQVYPFADHRLVGANWIFKDTKRGLEGKFGCAKTHQSQMQYMAHVSYLFAKNGMSHVLEYKAPMNTVLYTFHHPIVSAFWSCKFSDKGASVLELSTRLSKAIYAGLSFSYDPLRSGLKDAAALATYRNCQPLYGSDLLAKYALSNGLSLHLRVPVDPCVSVVVLAERRRFLAGLHATLNKTVRFILSTNLSDGSCTLTAIRNVKDIWKVSLTCTLPVWNTDTLSPKYGIKLSNKDIED